MNLLTHTPASVISASSTSSGVANDIAIIGAGGTTIRVNEIYPVLASGAAGPGRFSVLVTMTPYG